MLITARGMFTYKIILSFWTLKVNMKYAMILVMKKIYLFVLLIIILAAGGVFIIWHNRQSANNVAAPPTSTTTITPLPSPIPTPVSLIEAPTNPNNLDYPIPEFLSRITKKPFGIYITPSTSPVQPERFAGYHTGTDIEYTDTTTDVAVYAIADGTVVFSERASGYGGVFMILVNLNGTKHTVLYGHIRPSSLPKVGEQVTKGEQIALLGTGYSAETDGERRHLHFAVLSDNSLNIKGYVTSKSQLFSWIDPVTLYQ